MRFVVLAVIGVILTGCYHATVDTGLQPSGQKVEKNWAHGFVRGLVPPSTVETAAKCPNGVARVETRLSFANQLASFLTLGLYSPMSITVECAAVNSASLPDDAETVVVSKDADAEEIIQAFEDAAQRSTERLEPVWVSFE